MQQTPHEIKEKLLQALDNEYNVVDMAAVLEVITALEKAIITKEALERTRIGKYINELRKRTNNEQLARRAKDLVKSWRKLLPQTQERVNGEETHNSIPSSGNMTVLGPGPGPGIGPGPGPGNKTYKLCTSVPGTPRYKTSSPSLMIERSSSPYFSSASNSPLFNSAFQGSNLSFMPSNYAPVKVGCQLNTRIEPNSISKNLLVSNQSKNMTSSQIFSPDSPSALKENSGLYASLSLQRTSNLSPGLKSNSSSISPSINVSQNISPPLASSVIHSSLDLSKTNAANKRLRKDSSYSNSSSEIEVITLDSPVGNGVSEPIEKVSPNECSVFLNSTISNCIETEKSLVTNSKTPKRKRSFDKNELLENKLGDVLASLPSGSKHPKVKTTQQLIADLQAKKVINTTLSPNSLSSIDALHSSEAEVCRTKSELLKKFLISSQSISNENNHEAPVINSSVNVSNLSDYISNPASDVPSVINTNFKISSGISYPDPVDEEIKSILSALPPINMAEINLENAYSSPNHSVSVTEDLNKLENHWEYVNGVYDCYGNWKSWQECTEQRSYLGESFQVMPYVNID